jgi:antitoxin MazE3
MSKQIAVRLPDYVVEFIDQQVQASHTQSRAAFVLTALERERRRLIAARDAKILAAQAEDEDDFDSLASYAADLDSELE